MTNEITNMYARIKALGISELDQRQPLLVELIAAIVNHETESGAITAKASNQALTSMDYWANLQSVLKDFGFKFLGNGHFSAAYTHEMIPGRVIKVGFKKEDSGAAYTAWCRANQGRKGVPNVYHVARHAGCYTVVLDHLNSFDRDNYDHEVYADLARYFVESDCHDASDFAPGAYEFIETCQLIHKFFNGIASFDMHSGNIMFGKDGTPYITDPVSFTPTGGAIDRCTNKFDVESLLVEIELQAIYDIQNKARERRERKANRLVVMRKNAKHRKGAAKRKKENARKNILDRWEGSRFQDAMRAHHFLHGMEVHDAVWFRNSMTQLEVIAERYVAKNNEAIALQWVRPNGLPVDIANQRLLMG